MLKCENCHEKPKNYYIKNISWNCQVLNMKIIALKCKDEHEKTWDYHVIKWNSRIILWNKNIFTLKYYVFIFFPQS